MLFKIFYISYDDMFCIICHKCVLKCSFLYCFVQNKFSLYEYTSMNEFVWQFNKFTGTKKKKKKKTEIIFMMISFFLFSFWFC